ncbi:hypothetical protein KIW84_040373 [Lathyrus oleraceus]|uniref:Ionotropic glutamate receptor C-terminal domain-containing protein n=1 Tax=Pisum sativum TaxID=3888 RepID=A0A9D4XA17_PEA|nr:hypothetical protein KIW84_040373 [Pisum sativum]
MQKVSPASNDAVIKLRVGVPKKDGFTQFVKVVWNSRENKYNVSGFCMDIFNAVVNQLTFKVSLQIEPYVNEFKYSAGSYDSLIQQVPAKYDIVVGDVTIVANRSQFVDFTLPFTESGVRMLVSAQHGRHQTMWMFVQPFSWELWLSTLLISMLIGSVILIMERNVKTLPDDRLDEHCSFKKQLTAITMLWFPLSQAVLPERKVVANNCSIFVLMVWLLLAFVLMQSYTANLTSILTIDQLQPSFMDVNDLRNGNHSVGYQLGSENGGVTAIFGEVPYLNVFIQKVKSNYVITGPTYRTGGFGFVFPLNSNLTAHFSRAILNVTQNHEFMEKIEKKYFGKSIEELQQESSQISSIQKIVDLFTTEAEYAAVTKVGKELIWLQGLLRELRFIMEKSALCSDNQSAIHLAKNSTFHPRTKHIDIHYHFIGSLLEVEVLTFRKIAGSKKLSDMLTKIVTIDKLKLWSISVGLLG